MLNGKSPESTEAFPSNNPELTYRKGVLFYSFSGYLDATNSSTFLNSPVISQSPSIENKICSESVTHSKSPHLSSNVNPQVTRSRSNTFPSNSIPTKIHGCDSKTHTLTKNIKKAKEGHSATCSKDISPELSPTEKLKSKTICVRRSDLVSTKGSENKKQKNNSPCVGNSEKILHLKVLDVVKEARAASGNRSSKKNKPSVQQETEKEPSEESLKKEDLMASSVMNQHHSSYSNHNQRNYNNNNMTQSQYKGYSGSGTTTPNSNGFHNYSHSSSMNEITDNNKYQQNPKINSSHHNSHPNEGSHQASLSNSNYSQHHQNLSQGETRKEQRERREKEFVPSFLLIDACKTNNERKVREICRKLSTLSQDDVQPVANFQDPTGRTPMSYACAGGSIMMVEELSKVKYLDPNLGDNDGNTPLHYSSQAGHSEAVDLLLARYQGALDINCRNSTGLTPLMKAGLQGRTRCAKSLLSAGASSNLRDYSRGMTAAEWARLCGRHICAEMIARSAKDNRHSPVTDRFSPNVNRPLPGSQSMEFSRVNSDESSPYYHLYARSSISGATWLKNKIKKALGANTPAVRSLVDRRPTVSEGSYALMSNTICAGSLLLPSIKPLIEQQRPKQMSKKFTIPTLQVTSVKR